MKDLRSVIRILIISILFLLLIGCETTTDSTTTTYLDLDYSDFEGRIIFDSSMQLSMPEDDYYLYFYGPYCQACIILKPEILNAFYDAEAMFYIVVVTGYQDIHPDIDLEGTPTLLRIIDHEVVEVYVGNTQIRSVLVEIN